MSNVTVSSTKEYYSLISLYLLESETRPDAWMPGRNKHLLICYMQPYAIISRSEFDSRL